MPITALWPPTFFMLFRIYFTVFRIKIPLVPLETIFLALGTSWVQSAFLQWCLADHFYPNQCYFHTNLRQLLQATIHPGNTPSHATLQSTLLTCVWFQVATDSHADAVRTFSFGVSMELTTTALFYSTMVLVLLLKPLDSTGTLRLYPLSQDSAIVEVNSNCVLILMVSTVVQMGIAMISLFLIPQATS